MGLGLGIEVGPPGESVLVGSGGESHDAAFAPSTSGTGWASYPVEILGLTGGRAYGRRDGNLANDR